MRRGRRMRFFISYPDGKRQLAELLALEIEDAVQQSNIEAAVFLAFRDLPASVSWQGEIRREIRRADCALFLWTDESSRSVGQVAELGGFWLLETPRAAICYGVDPRCLPPYLGDCQAMHWADRSEQIASCLRRTVARSPSRSRNASDAGLP